jgi:predicted nucleic acid-binding protein
VSRVLIDSNIFVYAYDPADLDKHTKALRLIEEASLQGNLVLSAQILNELSSILLRRGKELNLDLERVRRIIENIAKSVPVVPLTPEMTLTALSSALHHGLSFWDGLIWAAARQHRLSTIYTEDFQHDREVEGVRFLNPFVS